MQLDSMAGAAEDPTSWRILAVYGKCADSAMIPSVNIGDGADGAQNYQV